MAKTLSVQLLDLFGSLNDAPEISPDISYLDPYQDVYVVELVKQFYTRFYSDTRQRVLVLGINPGRLGGGQTGIPFTDPYALSEYCGIDNSLPIRRELSSTFIYQFIEHFGGPEKFYSQFLFSSVCPLGFIRSGKNLNYYDDSRLFKDTRSFIEKSLKDHLSMNVSRKVLIIFGKKNAECVQSMKVMDDLFDKIVILPHPRYLMQYKRKEVNEHIKTWVEVFKSFV